MSGDSRAREYVKRRGLDADAVQKFGIGYAAARWDGLLERYGGTEDERHVLLRAGLIIERQPQQDTTVQAPLELRRNGRRCARRRQQQPPTRASAASTIASATASCSRFATRAAARSVSADVCSIKANRST
ncbi:MAG: hypothetical protein IPJ97_06050 [Proteobacteria bacterium]|nr:hypothetical protein [Pseudomonadota bacterium]